MTAVRQASVGRGHRDLFAALTGVDLPPVERSVTYALNSPGLFPTTWVAETTGLSPAAVSRAVSRLVALGNAVRIADPRDRRRTLIGLTDEAFGALQRWDDCWPQPYIGLVGTWADDERRVLSEWFNLVVAEHPALDVRAANTSAQWTRRAGVPGSLEAFRLSITRFVTTVGRSPGVEDLLPSLNGHIDKGDFALLLLVHRDDGATTQELAHLGDVDLSVAVRRVQSLVRAGLASRSRRDHDGRGWLVKVTPTGMAAIEESQRHRAARVPDVPRKMLALGLENLLTSYFNEIRSLARARTEV